MLLQYMGPRSPPPWQTAPKPLCAVPLGTHSPAKGTQLSEQNPQLPPPGCKFLDTFVSYGGLPYLVKVVLFQPQTQRFPAAGSWALMIHRVKSTRSLLVVTCQEDKIQECSTWKNLDFLLLLLWTIWPTSGSWASFSVNIKIRHISDRIYRQRTLFVQ